MDYLLIRQMSLLDGTRYTIIYEMHSGDGSGAQHVVALNNGAGRIEVFEAASIIRNDGPSSVSMVDVDRLALMVTAIKSEWPDGPTVGEMPDISAPHRLVTLFETDDAAFDVRQFTFSDHSELPSLLFAYFSMFEAISSLSRELEDKPSEELDPIQELAEP